MVSTCDRLSRRHRTRLMVFERDGEIYFTSAAMHARNELAGRACKRVAAFRWKLLREVEGQGCGEAETIISQFAVRTLTIAHFHSRREKCPESRCINSRISLRDIQIVDFDWNFLVLGYNRGSVTKKQRQRSWKNPSTAFLIYNISKLLIVKTEIYFSSSWVMLYPGHDNGIIRGTNFQRRGDTQKCRFT